ncbi:MAG: YHYH protein [Waterburya sp.]
MNRFFRKYLWLAIALMLTVLAVILPTYLVSSLSIPSTIAGVQAAKWGNNITISYTDKAFRYVSNGIPNHKRLAEYAVPQLGGMNNPRSTARALADPTIAHNYDFTIPLQPVKSDTPTPTNLGAIGVMISGAPLFNPYEGDNQTVAVLDNFTVKSANGQDVPFLDSCNGHPTPMGDYHYHGLPECITRTVDVEGEASHIIGVALDGFPIYGDRALNGSKISVDQLDACNGITSATPEFPQGIYHYVLPDIKDANSSIRCFTGKVSKSMSTR